MPMALSRNVASYWPTPKLRSQSPTSMIDPRSVAADHGPGETPSPGHRYLNDRNGSTPSAQLTEVSRVFLKRRGSEPPPLKQWEKRYDPWAIKAPLSQSCDDLTRPSATAQGCVIFVFAHDQFSRCGLLPQQSTS